MHPKLIDDMGSAMGEVYGSIVDQILINMARHFPFIYDDPGAFSAWQYQATKLAEMGKVTEESADIIFAMLAQADESLRQSLDAAIIDGLKDAEEPLKKAALAGLIGSGVIPPELSANQTQAFKAFYRQSADHLNLVNTTMLESTQQAYQATVSDIVARMNRTQSILNTSAGKVISGVSALNQAVRGGVQQMVRNGITGYIDHAGRRWSPEAYVTMDVRTTLANSARAAVWERQEQYGNDLYQVSWHDGARPLCYPWQGKVISRQDLSREVEDDQGNTVHVYAQSETSYGEAAGIFGVNCGHHPIPFIPGFSRIRPPRQDEKENAKEYQESQQQRALERKLREEKRDLAVLKAQGAPEELIQEQRERVKAASGKLDDFSAKTGRARRRGREGVVIKPTYPDKADIPPTFRHDVKDRLSNWFHSNWDNGNPPPHPTGIHIGPNNIPPQAGAQIPTQQPFNMKYGAPFDDLSQYRKPQRVLFEDAQKTLDGAPLPAKKLWAKSADDLQKPVIDRSVAGSHYDRYTRKTYHKTYAAAFQEDVFNRKNTVFFHEYGHNLDNLNGDGTRDSYLSMIFRDGAFERSLGDESREAVYQYFLRKHDFHDDYDALKAIQNSPGGMDFSSFIRQALRQSMPSEEYRAVRQTLIDAGNDDGVLKQFAEKYLKDFIHNEATSTFKLMDKDVGGEFCNWVKKTYNYYERADISDMIEKYMSVQFNIDFPFDFGHGKAYAVREGSRPKEAFAEMYSATVTQSDSLQVIKEFFPKSYDLFLEMLEEVTK